MDKGGEIRPLRCPHFDTFLSILKLRKIGQPQSFSPCRTRSPTLICAQRSANQFKAGRLRARSLARVILLYWTVLVLRKLGLGRRYQRYLP
jgi:hypothetical protein